MDIISKKIKNKDFLEKIFRTGIFFVISKGVAFLAPIILVGYVSMLEYGKVEYSYGIGRLFQSIASLGLIGYPYFVLKKNQPDKAIYFYAYGFFILFISIIYLFGRYLSIFEDQILFSYLFVFMFAIQGIYSQILKTEDQGYKGVMFDSGYYFILSIVIAVKVVHRETLIIDLLSWMMWAYMTMLGVFFVYRFFKISLKRNLIFHFSEFKEVVLYGIPLIVSGFFIYWLTSSARVYIGYFIGYEETGIYSFYFRIVGLSVVLQQFLYITFFKKLYMGSTSFLDKYYTTIMTIIFILCIIACLISIPITKYYLTDKDFSDYKLMLMLCIQMPMWVGISFCEGLIGRENIVMKMNIGIGLVSVAFALILFSIKSILDLHLFSLISLILFAIAFYIQLYLLKAVGVNLVKCKCFSYISVVLGIVVYILM